MYEIYSLHRRISGWKSLRGVCLSHYDEQGSPMTNILQCFNLISYIGVKNHKFFISYITYPFEHQYILFLYHKKSLCYFLLNNFSFSCFFTYPNIKHEIKKENVQLTKSVSDIINEKLQNGKIVIFFHQ